MAQSNRLLLVTAGVLACAFAPVPRPKTGTAEAVFGPTTGGPEAVRRSLLAALPRALQSGKVKGMGCIKGEKDPTEWVSKRLRAEEIAPGGPVRIRLDGCRPSEALALLAALVDAYEAGRAGSQDRDVAVAVWGQQAQVVRLAQGGNAGVVFFTRGAERSDGLAVLQRPRLVSTGKAR